MVDLLLDWRSKAPGEPIRILVAALVVAVSTHCHRRFASKLHRLRGAGRMLPPGSFSVFGDDCHRERDASFVTVVGILLLQLPSALDSVLASNACMPPRYSKLVLCSTGGRDLWRISFWVCRLLNDSLVQRYPFRISLCYVS